MPTSTPLLKGGAVREVNKIVHENKDNNCLCTSEYYRHNDIK